jgi:hypothetical protein
LDHGAEDFHRWVGWGMIAIKFRKIGVTMTADWEKLERFEINLKRKRILVAFRSKN